MTGPSAAQPIPFRRYAFDALSTQVRGSVPRPGDALYSASDP